MNPKTSILKIICIYIFMSVLLFKLEKNTNINPKPQKRINIARDENITYGVKDRF